MECPPMECPPMESQECPETPGVNNECPAPECPTTPPCHAHGGPICEIRPGQNFEATDYACDGCRIRVTVCERDGDPNGTVKYYSPSSKNYQEILNAWTIFDRSNATECREDVEDLENCPVCTEHQYVE